MGNTATAKRAYEWPSPFGATMQYTNLSHLEIWDVDSGTLNVIIETTKGSRNKLKYDPKRGLFQLSKVLPRGAIFPYDFGFIPSTQGEDGDPLDILVLMDEPTSAGCLIPCRLLGVIEAKQTEDGETHRNDRLIAVAEHSRDYPEVRSIRELADHLLHEIEHFFISYNDMDGKEFRPIGNYGPHQAEKLIRKAAKRFAREADEEDAEQRNGQHKISKGK